MSTKYFVDAGGAYVGGFDGVEPPLGSIEVPLPPENAAQVWDGAAWQSAPTDLIAYAAKRRWEKEVGGITVSGATIDTSRESQAMINGAFNWAKENPTETVHFKAASGWVELDADTMVAIATAVGSHVQQCFATEAAVAAAIAGGTITSEAQIDAAFA